MHMDWILYRFVICIVIQQVYLSILHRLDFWSCIMFSQYNKILCLLVTELYNKIIYLHYGVSPNNKSKEAASDIPCFPKNKTGSYVTRIFALKNALGLIFRGCFFFMYNDLHYHLFIYITIFSGAYFGVGLILRASWKILGLIFR